MIDGVIPTSSARAFSIILNASSASPLVTLSRSFLTRNHIFLLSMW